MPADCFAAPVIVTTSAAAAAAIATATVLRETCFTRLLLFCRSCLVSCSAANSLIHASAIVKSLRSAGEDEPRDLGARVDGDALRTRRVQASVGGRADGGEGRPRSRGS